MKSIAAYGSWPSALTADELAKKGSRFGHLCLDRGTLYWLEVRASENGRGVLMRANANGSAEEVLPPSVSVRSKVHEYGGGDYLVADGKVYFSNAEDDRIYLFDGSLTALTPLEGGQKSRFADFCLVKASNCLIAVREIHRQNEVVNELVSLCLQSKTISILHSGFDFYSFPRISPNEHRLCWTCWNQPDMPWEAAQLWLADYHADGSVDASHRVTGGKDVSVFQPAWSDDGILHYVSDQSGWSNIYNHRDGVLNALTPIDRDFAVPQWIFGLATYVVNRDGSLFALYFENGQQQLCHIIPDKGHIEPIALPFKHFEGALLGDRSYLYFCAAGPANSNAIYRYDIAEKSFQALSEISAFPLPAGDISVAEAIQFESVNQRSCHGFYYKPRNSNFEAPENSRPPLIVISHGGPTAISDNSLDPAIQFWTNRGFAVVDVNYAGSSGFGKKYRDLLKGNWGLVDVEDCVAAARYLVDKKLADENALLIRGGSAGGYTTLCALTFTDIFAAGMSRYGVADLESLAADSHKFEARYLDKIVGPYPQAKAVYQQRSPINHTQKLNCPILLLQGSEDKVVPPNQAEQMVKALDQKSIAHAYLLFEGEGHGFRQAETIRRAASAELYFYRKILGLESDEKIQPVIIKNFIDSSSEV